MLTRALKQLGKSLLIVTGVGYGVIKALDALGPDFPPDASSSDASAREQTAASTPPRDDSARSDTRKTSPARPNTAKPDSPNLAGAYTPVYTPEALRRLDGMEERLIRMERSLELLAAPVERTAPQAPRRDTEHFVTRAELNLAMEQLSGGLETDIERRFEVQNRSVQSLRAMIARTDELLEQVLESIESAGVHA